METNKNYQFNYLFRNSDNELSSGVQIISCKSLTEAKKEAKKICREYDYRLLDVIDIAKLNLYPL